MKHLLSGVTWHNLKGVSFVGSLRAKFDRVTRQGFNGANLTVDGGIDA
jgi:hypothetical protein